MVSAHGASIYNSHSIATWRNQSGNKSLNRTRPSNPREVHFLLEALERSDKAARRQGKRPLRFGRL